MNTTIKNFKSFLEKHPLLIKEIREGKLTMQEAYEQYVLLGEEDPSWHRYSNQEKATPKEDTGKLTKKLWKHIENLDMNQLETHINDVSGALDHIIVLIDQFKQYRSNQSGSMHQQSKD